MRIPYENLKLANEAFYPEFRRAFDEVLDSGWFILGKQVLQFEEEFAAFHGASYCLGVASGLDALTLSLMACDFPKGSEVVVPSNTYIATILAILNAGLKPVLVEPDLRTYNINPSLIRTQLTSKTVAVMVVHLYGKSCNMKPIQSLCAEYGLKLVEDCAQSHDARYFGQQTGTFGDFGCFSFYPTKNLGALGDAGAILCKSKDHYQKLKALRNYGSFQKYHNEYIGTNSRLDEVQAALLRIKLKKLNEITDHKRQLASLYFKGLDPNKFILPIKMENFRDVYHIFNVRHPERERLKQYLAHHEIETAVHYPIPPHRQKAMQGILNGDYPISTEIHNTTLSLPISFGTTEADVSTVIECMNQFN